jgi:putative peptidoglycan lipid II flippase
MNLYRSFFTVGGLTLVSRVLGFFRDILIGGVLGTGLVADAFVVAFRFPNLFRRWFGEGAFNSAFIPLFAKRLEGEGPDQARAFAEEAMAGLAFVLILISAFCMLAMPWLMYGLAPGFAKLPEKFDLAVVMSRIAFPYLFCMSLVALLSGVLNSLGRFVESSLISVVLNLTLIAAMLIAMSLGYGKDPAAGIVLAWGIFAAGILQLALLVWGAWRAGYAPRLRWPRYTDGMKQLVALGVPGIVAGGITQINIVIGGMVASLENGAASYLFYADRLYELPLAIVGIAIGVVLLPDIARHMRAGNDVAVQESQNRSLEFAMFLTIPSAVALAVIPHQIVTVLFQRGAFVAADTIAVSAALAVFALGLPAFVMIKVFSPAFFAREDTKSPMRFAGISLTLNTIGSVGLFLLFQRLGWMPHVGIAIATTLGGWLNAILLWRALESRGYFKADKRLRRALPMVLVSSAVMGLALAAGANVLAPWLAATEPTFVRFSALTGIVGLGAIVYFAAAFATGAISRAALMSAVRRRAA